MASQEDIQARIENAKGKIEKKVWAVEPKVHQMRENLPNRTQVLGLLVWLVLGITALTIGGLTLAGGAIFLATATPLAILFTPILVPLGAFLSIITTGILVAVGVGLATLATVMWLYKYLKGEEPMYYDRVNAARSRLANTVVEVKGWARDHAPQVHAAPSA